MAKNKSSFAKDLRAGTAGEQFVVDVFKKHTLSCLSNEIKAERQFWDLELSLEAEKKVTFEVKYDLYCAKSGNIAIEFFNPKAGKPSGLTATKAHGWVHVVTNPMSAWLASVNKLKEFCENTKPLRIISSGGDDNSSMYLYKKDLIFDAVFARIDELSYEDLRKLLENLYDCPN